MKNVVTFLVTGCYSGRLPLAPGTWGTLVGVGFFLLIKNLSPITYVVTTLTFIILAIWLSNYAQKIYGEIDPPCVVIDEIAGFLVTMAFHNPNTVAIVAGFILFRLFDIVKPWPVNWVERRFSDGRGIVLDDVFAGVYANASLWLVGLLLPYIWK